MKTTPTLGLKLYDGTDAPDFVSGYNASMETLDGKAAGWDAEPAWGDIEGKPFETVGNTLTTRDGALGLSTAAQASLVPAGGAAGQVLVKKSDTDHDAGWVAPYALTGNVCANADGSLLLQGAAMKQLQLSGGSGASAALQGNNSQLVLMKGTDTYGQYTESGVTLRNASGSTYYAIDGDGKGVLKNVKSINGAPFDNTIHEIKTGSGLTAWLRAFPSTGEWWSGPGEVTITANGSTQQYTGNWTVYRTPSIGNAYFQGGEGRAKTAHFASLKTDHNANMWSFVMSIKDTEPTFQYVGVITTQLTAMLKRVTTFDAS